jgi:integrase
VSRLNIYNKNKRLNNYARYGFTRFYFWFVNKPTVIALNSVQPELLPFHQYSLYRRWNSACKRADVIDSSGKHKFVLHDVRRYGIRYLQEVKGFSPEITRICFSGHKDIQVFEKTYNKITQDSIDYFVDVVTRR